MHMTHFCMAIIKEAVADLFHLHILLALSHILFQFDFFYYRDAFFPYFKHPQDFCSSDNEVADDLDIGSVDCRGGLWKGVNG